MGFLDKLKKSDDGAKDKKGKDKSSSSKSKKSSSDRESLPGGASGDEAASANPQRALELAD